MNLDLTEDALINILKVTELSMLLKYIEKQNSIKNITSKSIVKIRMSLNSYCSYLRETKTFYPDILVTISNEKKEFSIFIVKFNITIIIKMEEK